MTEKTKKMLVISAGLLACLALAVGIAMRFGGKASIPQSDSSIPIKDGDTTIVVNIKDSDPNSENHNTEPNHNSDPGMDADSAGTEQSLQADPIKPAEPEPPKPPVPAAQKDQEHAPEDVPQENRNTPTPPKYTETPKPEPAEPPKPTEPDPGSKDEAGKVYVPGFGYIEDSGANQGDTLDDMYENGNKIGIMG